MSSNLRLMVYDTILSVVDTLVSVSYTVFDATISGWKKLKRFMFSSNHVTLPYYEDDVDIIESEYEYVLTKRTIGICRELPNPKWMKIGHVEQMNIYPISFGPELTCSYLKFTQQGLSMEDNELILRNEMFLVYNSHTKTCHTFLDYMGLTAITVNTVDNSTILLDAPGMYPIYVKLNNKICNPVYVPSWQEPKKVECFVCPETYTWLNKYLTSTNLYLIQTNYTHTPKSSDAVDRNWVRYVLAYNDVKEHETTYPDINRCVVMTRSTHDKLRADANSLLDSYSIRPNVLISTSGFPPFAEEEWEWIRIGDVVMRKIKPVPRYRMEGSLQSHDIVYSETMHLGIYYGLYVPGEVRTGDDVYIHL